MPGDCGSRLEHRIERAPHIADSGDTEGDKQGQDQVVAVIRRMVEEDMGVHVPEPRYQVAAVSIHYLARRRSRPAGVHREYAVPGDHHRAFGMKLPIGYVDHGGMGDSERLREGWSGSEKEQGRREGKEAHTAMLTRSQIDMLRLDV